jgi:hypothetical protein
MRSTLAMPWSRNEAFIIASGLGVERRRRRPGQVAQPASSTAAKARASGEDEGFLHHVVSPAFSA